MRAIGNKYPCKQASYNKEELKIESKLSFISSSLFFVIPLGFKPKTFRTGI